MKSRIFAWMAVEDWVKQHLGPTLERLGRIRFGRGVVGRTTFALIVALVVLGVIAWRLADATVVLVQVLLAALALGVIGLFVLYFVRIMRFADANPMAATLEGAEWIQLEQIRLAAKGLPNPPAMPVVLPSRELGSGTE